MFFRFPLVSCATPGGCQDDWPMSQALRYTGVFFLPVIGACSEAQDRNLRSAVPYRSEVNLLA